MDPVLLLVRLPTRQAQEQFYRLQMCCACIWYFPRALHCEGYSRERHSIVFDWIVLGLITLEDEISTRIARRSP